MTQAAIALQQDRPHLEAQHHRVEKEAACVKRGAGGCLTPSGENDGGFCGIAEGAFEPSASQLFADQTAGAQAAWAPIWMSESVQMAKALGESKAAESFQRRHGRWHTRSVLNSCVLNWRSYGGHRVVPLQVQPHLAACCKNQTTITAETLPVDTSIRP
eukprot:CAMPEP_0115884916 /NCGR_PEP_ID=MMETSP0287-20121206/30381_1 /TAXON_ID=412157 /ORGANISM="Chrysochromulina rotalis, Strain UIO044" /LENGTH=158 /DNA_ID=CAMNT_0003341269 /DNA_START=116 /DNA_END=595 /DNA_ORIENTATION=-